MKNRIIGLAICVTLVAMMAGCGNKQEVSGSVNGHDYVDLGLPSGTLWATCNVGADQPQDYGKYFAWGETNPKASYDRESYKYTDGNNGKLMKYCNDPESGSNGFTDNLTTLQAEDDAATVNWGEDWTTPSNEQWDELIQFTTKEWTTQNGVKGCLFTAKNGNTLFFPAAGRRFEDEFRHVGSEGFYWSSQTGGGFLTWGLCFNAKKSDKTIVGDLSFGHSVRPVCYSR